MQRFSQRGNVSVEDSTNSPQRNSDFEFNDFNDVFGGPPRRFSVQERRHSDETDTEIGSSNPWSGRTEKPVFGEEGVNRRRYASNDFFDDIFRGGESSCSSPRKYEREGLSSSPASRVMSPGRPLPPKAEPFGTSLPAQFSLPAKLNKVVELPTFGSPTGISKRNKEATPSSPGSYLYSPLSRSSKQAEESPEKLRNESQLPKRVSALSREISLGRDESSDLMKNDETEGRKKEVNDSEVSDNSNQFHFSIYKWAIKDIPLTMPVRGSNGSRLKEKDNKPERSQIACESMAFDNASFASSNDRLSVSTEASAIKRDNAGGEDGELRENVKETTLPSAEAKVLNVYDDGDKGEEALPAKVDKPAKESPVVKETAHKSALKTLSELFYTDNKGSNVEKAEKAGRKESGSRTKKPPTVLPAVENIKKKDGKRSSLDSVDAGKTSVPGSPRNSGNFGKSKVKGKVKDFVKMFNQDAVSKPRTDVASNNQSVKRKEGGTVEVENKVDVSLSEADAKMQKPGMRKETSLPDITADAKMQKPDMRKETSLPDITADAKMQKPDMRKETSLPDITVMDDDFGKTTKQDSPQSDSKYTTDNASEQKDSSATNASATNGSKTIFGDSEESFEENILIKEIIQDDKELQQSSDSEGMQLMDSKIRQWSSGKLGNIRSLLSTLQYVLWPDSGWKPVPLMDIIEGNAVKRSYQRALLCLHPDKLQQKGATSQQKYMAEKVFDILQDAWTHFNTLGPM